KDDSYAPLRRLIQPYLLRRLKTDRAIVADLPDKTEVKAFCLLSSAQAALYQKTVDELGRAIAGLTQGIERRGLVLAHLMRFQEDATVPFFVLSVKAGGTGLNLTAASHVVHFDRWWNPAVEDQATDRAYRIGQHKNVLVHKLVCRGTVEERIDRLIEDKQAMV